MGHLPPTGWGDVVTREYLDLRLDQQQSRIDARFGGMEGRFDVVDERFSTLEAQIESSRNKVIAAFRGELNQAVVTQTRLIIVSLFSTVVVLGGFVLALARLAV